MEGPSAQSPSFTSGAMRTRQVYSSLRLLLLTRLVTQQISKAVLALDSHFDVRNGGA